MPKKFFIGIDLGGTNLKIAVLNQKYSIVFKKVLNTREFKGKNELIQAIVFSIENIIKRSGLRRNQVAGIGLGLPGLIDRCKGIVHFLPNIPGWKEINLRSILEKKIKLKVVVDNDVKAMALAEYNLGAAKGFKNVICITLGTGVGGAIILDGKLYRGSDNAAGEVGHVPINTSGPHCACHGIACLESYIGNKKILEQARAVFKSRIPLEELSILAKRKNKKALVVWNLVGERLGVALTSVVNLLNLDAIIIGGGVSKAGQILFKKVRFTIKERAMHVQARRVKVLKANLGSDAGLIGAAMLVKERVSGA